jgi:hypothetical protein
LKIKIFIILIFIVVNIYSYSINENSFGYSQDEAVQKAIKRATKKAQIENINYTYRDYKIKVQKTENLGAIYELDLNINFIIAKSPIIVQKVEKVEVKKEIIKETIKPVEVNKSNENKLIIFKVQNSKNCNLYILIINKNIYNQKNFNRYAFQENENYYNSIKKYIYKLDNNMIILKLDDGEYFISVMNKADEYFITENINYETYFRNISIKNGKFLGVYQFSELKFQKSICKG